MSFFGIFGKKSAGLYNIPAILEGVVKAGGQGIVEIPFQVFVDFAKENGEILPSQAGKLRCKLMVLGKSTETEFVAGMLHHQLKDKETFIRVTTRQSIEELFGTDEPELIARKVASDMLRDTDSEGLALALIWLMQQQIWMNLQRFTGDPFGSGYEEPEFQNDFLRAAAGGYTVEDDKLALAVYDPEYQEALDRHLGPHWETEACKSAVAYFDNFLRDLSDFHEVHELGNAVLEEAYKRYLKLAEGDFLDDTLPPF